MTTMRRLAALLIPLALALPAYAEGAPDASDPPLSAAEFDALTQGKTFDTHEADLGSYGLETFLPDNKVIWSDADGCLRGEWYAEGAQICFSYEDRDWPVCWTYHRRPGGAIAGYFEGDRDAMNVMLYPGAEPAVCKGDVGV